MTFLPIQIKSDQSWLSKRLNSTKNKKLLETYWSKKWAKKSSSTWVLAHKNSLIDGSKVFEESI